MDSKPVKSEIGIIEWQLSNLCNYNCSYCSTKIHISTYPALDNYIVFIDKLRACLGKSKWLVQLGGYGEPFMVPNFIDIVKKLVSNNYYIGLVTNFSFAEKDMVTFCKLVSNKLLYFNASYHADEVELAEFIKKIRRITTLIKIPIEVSIVGASKDIAKIMKIDGEFKKYKIPTTIQAERFQGEYRKYTKEEIKKIFQLSKKIYGFNIKNDFKRLFCYSGVNYFILDNDGDAYVCHPYKSLFRRNYKVFKSGYLGNILRGSFKLRKNKIKCQANVCFCSTPWRARGWGNLPSK